MSHNIPKVSITVVTYNHGKWLAECLESIVTQETDFPFEVLVGDDASTDGETVKIIQEYTAKYPEIIKSFLREKNIGPTANLFDLIQKARGIYIAHVDGDDGMYPGKLQLQNNYLDINQDVVLIGHRMTCIHADGHILGKFPVKKPHRLKFDAHYLLANHALFAHSSIMYRSNGLNKWSIENFEIIDLHIYLSLFKEGMYYAVLEQELGYYRRGVGLASTNFIDKPQRLIPEFARTMNLSPKAINKYCARLEHSQAYNAFKQKQYRHYFLYSLKSIKLSFCELNQLLFLIHAAFLFLLCDFNK